MTDSIYFIRSGEPGPFGFRIVGDDQCLSPSWLLWFDFDDLTVGILRKKVSAKIVIKPYLPRVVLIETSCFGLSLIVR